MKTETKTQFTGLFTEYGIDQIVTTAADKTRETRDLRNMGHDVRAYTCENESTLYEIDDWIREGVNFSTARARVEAGQLAPATLAAYAESKAMPDATAGLTGPDWEPTKETRFFAQRDGDSGPFAFGPTRAAALEKLHATAEATEATEATEAPAVAGAELYAIGKATAGAFEVESHGRPLGAAMAFSVSWVSESDGTRFHVWTPGPGQFDPEEESIYKNPPLGTATDAPGFFWTRHLNAAAKAWAETVAAINAIPESVFRAAEAQKETAERATNAEHEAAAERAERAELARLIAKYGNPAPEAATEAATEAPARVDCPMCGFNFPTAPEAPAGPSALNGYPVVKVASHENGYFTVLVERNPDDYAVATWWPDLKDSWSWGHYFTGADARARADSDFTETADRNSLR